MKLNKWLYGAFALGLLAACSERDIAPGGNENENWTGNPDAIGYLGVTLELPSELETRAGDEGDQGNDDFDDGLKEEYNVKNAALLLFTGNTGDEANAQFCGAYKLVPDEAFDQPNGDNITVSFQKAAKVKNPAALKSGDQLWGLALVNYDEDHFEIGYGDSDYGNLTIKKPTTGTLTTVSDFNTTESMTYDTNGNCVIKRKTVGTDDPDVMTFSEVRKLITSCDFRKTDDKGNLTQIFMTNAPLSDKQGTTAAPSGLKIQTLAKLDKDKLKTNELEARQNPAGCIFVERALAKITCSSFPEYAYLTHTKVTNSETGVAKYEDEDVRIKVNSVKWILDNEEENSYIIRNVTDVATGVWIEETQNYNKANKWRFIGKEGMNDHNYDSNSVHKPGTADNPAQTWYRTYWCVDPKYSNDKVFNNQADVTSAPFVTWNKNSVLYSHENTFDVAHQNYKNTTRVVFEVAYNNKLEKKSGEDWVEQSTEYKLYALRDELKSFYLQEDAQNLLMNTVLGSGTLHDLIVALLPDGTSSVNYTASDFSLTCGIAGDADVDATNGIEEGDYIVKTIAMNTSLRSQLDAGKLTAQSAKITNDLKDVAKSANSANHIVPFTDNTCYYVVYIQHFGKTYCPLVDEFTGSTDTWTGNRTNTVYGSGRDATTKYLGRYGMVRNNWYDLSVSKINNLGKATVPDGNAETSDDNKEELYFLSARIHILSWAKRTQSVSF